MIRYYNENTHMFEWKISHWYEKVIFVLGWIYTALLVLAFGIGFIAGILEA